MELITAIYLIGVLVAYFQLHHLINGSVSVGWQKTLAEDISELKNHFRLLIVVGFSPRLLPFQYL